MSEIPLAIGSMMLPSLTQNGYRVSAIDGNRKAIYLRRKSCVLERCGVAIDLTIPLDDWLTQSPAEMLRYLLETSGKKQSDLVGIIGSSGIVSEVVNGKRSISKSQAKELGKIFKVSPSLFI